MNSQAFSLKTHNGKLTIRNPATNGHRTFSIKTQPENARFAPGERIVALLTGSDNTASYTPFGFIQPDGSVRLFRSKADGLWLKYADMVSRPDAYPSAEYLFEGHCRVCNRLLTHPESIKSGIGPNCGGKARKSNQAKYRPVRPA